MIRRGRIEYHVGNEYDPGNPFGRSALTIDVDGRARHELITRGPSFAWTAVVIASARERLWSALEEAGFPACPMIMPPAGATIRSLTVGEGADAATIDLPFHASVAGYDVAFSILDAILRQTSEDMVKDAPATSSPLVEGVARAEPPRPREPEPPPPVDRPGLGPGPAFLLAYLPAHRIAHEAKLAHLQALTDPALQRERTFGGAALKIAGRTIDAIDARAADLARAAGVPLGDAIASELTTPAAKAAWKAGLSARAVTIAAELAVHVAYLRASAPENAALRSEAAEHARALRDGAARLAEELAETRRPLAIRHKDDAARMVAMTGDGFADLAGLAQDLGTFFGAMGYHLDDAARRLFDVVDTIGVALRVVRGWDELEPRILAPARPELQPILERALGFLRDESRRIVAGPEERSNVRRLPQPPSAILARAKAVAKLADDVRARAMAPEDAYERLAPKSWLGDARRWFVAERVPPGTTIDGPMLSVAWTSWAVRREPTSIDVLTSICADPKNAALAEDHALEACRRMAVWGWRTPPRVIWMAEPSPPFFAYRDARPFRARADELLRKVFDTKLAPCVADRSILDEAKLVAKLDLLRANEWPSDAGRNPFEPIVEVWRLGYALAAVLDVGVVLVAPAPALQALVDPLVD